MSGYVVLAIVTAGFVVGTLLALSVLSLLRTGSPMGILRCLALAPAAAITVALAHGMGIGI
jgi:hypothetical protein